MDGGPPTRTRRCTLGPDFFRRVKSGATFPARRFRRVNSRAPAGLRQVHGHQATQPVRRRLGFGAAEDRRLGEEALRGRRRAFGLGGLTAAAAPRPGRAAPDRRGRSRRTRRYGTDRRPARRAITGDRWAEAGTPGLTVPAVGGTVAGFTLGRVLRRRRRGRPTARPHTRPHTPCTPVAPDGGTRLFRFADRRVELSCPARRAAGAPPRYRIAAVRRERTPRSRARRPS